MNVANDRDNQIVELEELDRAERVDAGTPETLLQRYFNDAAGMPVMKPEQELALGRGIGALDRALWAALLSFAPALEPMLEQARGALPEGIGDFAGVRRAASQLRKRRTKAAQQALDRAAARLAAVVRD